MRLAALGLISATAVAVFGQRSANPTRSLIGTWRYEASTVKLDRAAHNRQSGTHRAWPNSRQEVMNQERVIAKSLKSVRISFMPNKMFRLTASNPATRADGTWSLN